MYLKSLEIQGFKSFPDKTVLSFEKEITAIVGPNGSGKSNIADAIRWVLGEQSTKTLRGAKMEDVVFAGTDRRRPQGYAEVSLTIDNSDGKLNVDYAELTVTRRYYRSGESEFYINRQSVRLRDIHELFMDTGLGRDGYSIIGQGRIDEILARRSEERRDFFEEAAGITKFRYRKEEAERRLGAAEENLLRIRDIIAELETQVAPLREQSEKAKKYLTLRDELRLLEVSLWLDQLDRLQGGLRTLTQDYETADAGLEEARGALAALYRESEALASSMMEKDVEAEQRRARLSDMESENAAAEGDIAVFRAKIAGNLENITRIEQEMQRQEAREGGLSAQIEQKRARVQALEATVAESGAEVARLSAEAAALAARAEDVSSRIEGLLAEKGLLADEASDLRQQLSASLSAAEEIRGRQAEISAEEEGRLARLEQERVRSQALERELAEYKEKRDGMKNMRRGFEMRLAGRTEKLKALDGQRRDAEVKIRTIAGRIALLEEMEREYEGLSRASALVMKESARGGLKNVHGTVASLIAVPEKYTIAVETAVGGGLSHIVVRDEKDAKAAIGYLKSTRGGRATFLPLSTIRGSLLAEKGAQAERGAIGIASELCECQPEYREIVRSLLGRTLIVDHLDSAIRIADQYRHRFRIVTLDGQLINPGGSMTGGSTAKNVGVLSRANELTHLREELQAEKQKQSEMEESFRQAERLANAASYELEVMDGELRQTEDEILKLESAREQHQLLLASLESSIADLCRERDRLAARLSETEQKRQAAAAEIEAKEAEAADREAEAARLAGGEGELAQGRAALSEKISAAKERLLKETADMEATARSADELTSLFNRLSGDRRQQEKIAAEYREKNREFARMIEEKTELLEERRAAAVAVKEEIGRLVQDKLAIEALRVRKEKAGQSKNEEILRLERERARLEQKKAQAEAEERQLTDKLWESYELTRMSAQSVRVELPNLQKAARRIGELKGSIRALGSINIDAIEEYAKVSERYEFLSAQKADMEKAREELLRLIGEIGSHMKTVFSKQFALINQYFGETFSEIFGGGTAALELTDPSEVLSSGIEIKVMLPGKALKTITLLSGGEKAFVAIALYFAILRVRPTPFCVLDEIEAALDDVNVDRFADYLRKLSATTQFIVITHRRGTMERSDMLYGVTMQERGVSKLLALHIDEVERRLNFKPE